jgi:hypothetical protein
MFKLLLWLVVAGEMLGPIVFLVWVWRRTGSWVMVALSGLLAVPTASFVLGGGIAALVTAYQVYVLHSATFGWSKWSRVGLSFLACGMYSVGFSGTGLLITAPILGLWYLVHRPSFRRVTGGPRVSRVIVTLGFLLCLSSSAFATPPDCCERGDIARQHIIAAACVACFSATVVASTPDIGKSAGDIARLQTDIFGMCKEDFEKLLPQQRETAVMVRLICVTVFYHESKLKVDYLNEQKRRRSLFVHGRPPGLEDR